MVYAMGVCAQNFEEFINPSTIVIAKLVIGMMLCCHWFGCVWWMVSEIEQADARDAAYEAGSGAPMSTYWCGEVDGEQCDNFWQVPLWLKEREDFGVKYSHAFLWGAGMVTAMVPFDVMPITTTEAYVTLFAMFFGVFFNAVVISSLTTALTSMNSKRELAGKQLDKVCNFSNLPGTLSEASWSLF